MPLSNYTELQASVLDWMKRNGQTGQVVDWIALAEARLNRELGPVETNASLTGVVGSRDLDISALPLVEPVQLFIADASSPDDERILTPINPANMAYSGSNARPTEWAFDSSSGIKLNWLCDLPYVFRLRYRSKLSLATSSTNWLLTNHPDVYLAASIVWGSAYNIDLAGASAWKQLLDEAIPSLQRLLARSRKGLAKVDPAITAKGGHISYSEWLVA